MYIDYAMNIVVATSGVARILEGQGEIIGHC